MNGYGYRLLTLMDRQGIRQRELAERTGISQSTISMYISGKVDMSAKNAIAISRALHVSTDSLLGLERIHSDDVDELVTIYSQLSPTRRKLLVRLARAVAE